MNPNSPLWYIRSPRSTETPSNNESTSALLWNIFLVSGSAGHALLSLDRSVSTMLVQDRNLDWRSQAGASGTLQIIFRFRVRLT